MTVVYKDNLTKRKLKLLYDLLKIFSPRNNVSMRKCDTSCIAPQIHGQTLSGLKLRRA